MRLEAALRGARAQGAPLWARIRINRSEDRLWRSSTPLCAPRFGLFQPARQCVERLKQFNCKVLDIERVSFS